MSLETGKRIHRFQWDILPISKDVLDRVNAIAMHQGHPLVAKNFKFQGDPDGEEIDEEDVNKDDVTSIDAGVHHLLQHF